MKRKIILLLLIINSMTIINAQDHQHNHARNEIGISPGVTYSPSHKAWGFGVHAHYFRTLGAHSPWAIGGGIETVTTHGAHWTISTGVKYTIIDRLNIGLMPGVTFYKKNHEHEHLSEFDHEHNDKARFSLHIEIGYDLIHTEHFHCGPAIDYSWSRHDNHFMLGVHCAYGF